MKTIWKFVTPTKERFSIEVPRDFKILTVARGHIWIEGSFNNMRDRKNQRLPIHAIFTVLGTGHKVPAGFEYVGTFFEDDTLVGNFVWHVYIWSGK